MEFQIPINSLFTQVFGIAAPLIRRFDVSTEEKKPDTFYYQVGEISTPVDEETIFSSLGTPVNFWMAFDGGIYNKRVNGIIQKVTQKGMYLPFTSVASFSRAKRFTETYMSGQDGSIIEEYGFEPWSIRIQGFILKNDKSRVVGNSSVEDQVKELKTYESLSDAILVKGRVFEWLGIHSAAITNISFPEARNLDMEIIKPYEITMRSVQPVELINV